MFKKLLLAISFFIATTGFALAQVDVNKADQAALDGIKGVGPSLSKRILEERKKGEFKDWADFEKRVQGIGEKNSVKFSQAGLTVNGQAKPNAPAASAKEEKKDKKAKADAKPVADAKPATDAKPAADAAKADKVADAKDTKDAKKAAKEAKKEAKKEAAEAKKEEAKK